LKSAVVENFVNDGGICAVRSAESYDRLKEYDKVSVSDIKDIIGKDAPKNVNGSIHTKQYLQIIIYDASTGSVEIAYMPENGIAPGKPEFVKVK
jgi:hypothetical protein